MSDEFHYEINQVYIEFPGIEDFLKLTLLFLEISVHVGIHDHKNVNF